jgi:ketosteroid isomerase-like protein
MDNSNSRRNFVKGVAAAGAVCLLSSRTLASSSTQTQPGLADMEVRAALAKFVHAFDDLDWEGFRLAFDDSATVFYPRAFPERANGRAEFENNFKMVFQQIRGAKTVTPFMDIRPMDMRIQIFGDIAIATFHLDDRAGFLNRRTIALSKSIASWKIVHLHASEVATNDEHR